MSVIVCSLKPCDLSEEKASSRFGPSGPWEPASASVWHDAHEPLLVVARKSCFPWATSPWPTRPTAPQPAAARAARRTVAIPRARRRLRARLGEAEVRDRLVTRGVDRE